MTDLIEFTETGFSFRVDGVRVDVHTEVGNCQTARVIVRETCERDGIDQEPSDE